MVQMVPSWQQEQEWGLWAVPSPMEGGPGMLGTGDQGVPGLLEDVQIPQMGFEIKHLPTAG